MKDIQENLISRKVWREAFRARVEGLLRIMDEADSAGTLYGSEDFAAMLDLALSSLQVPAFELCRDEDVAKSSLSKWINGHAVPTAPTRKTVLLWVRGRARDRIEELEAWERERS